MQRDLLPLVEGTTVNTKYGMVKTDHILFIASGAFHLAKPSDLIPELQGRFPIRVELGSLSVDDFEAILTQTHASLVKQYTALLATEGVTLELAPEAIRRIAQIAFDVNERTENIGARRLATVMERLLDEVSFDAPNRSGQTVRLDAAAVDAKLAELAKNEDLSRYILCASAPAPQSASRFDCRCSRPSKISVSTVSNGRSVIDASLTAAPPLISSAGSCAAAAQQLAVHALDRAGDGVGAAAHQRVAGVGREIDRFAGRRLQSRRAHLEGAQHQAEAGQDQAAEEAAVCVERVDGDRGADHDDQRRPRRAALEHAVARADQRDPAVDAEPGRMVVAVGDAAGRRGAHDPARLDVPELELRFGAAPDALAGDDAAEHARRRPAAPATGLRRGRRSPRGTTAPVREHGCAGLRRGVQRPLQAGVADVDGEEGHRARFASPLRSCGRWPAGRRSRRPATTGRPGARGCRSRATRAPSASVSRTPWTSRPSTRSGCRNVTPAGR